MWSNKFFAKHRILISKIISIIFAIILIFTKPVLVDTIIYVPMLFFGLILVIIGILGRIFSSLFLSDKRNNTVVNSGMYSITRNPLYFFSFIGIEGIFFIYGSVFAIVLVTVFYAVYYRLVIKFEESSLSEKLGTDYVSYLQSGVPRFFPKFSRWKSDEHITINYKVVKKTMVESSYFFIVALLVILLLFAHAIGVVPIYIAIL